MKLEKKEWIFIGKFVVIFSVLEFIIFNIDMSLLQFFIAQTQANFFNLQFRNNLIFVKDGAFAIVPSCTGVVSGSILAGIVFSLKKPGLKRKTGIFLAGLTALIILNYFRIMLVIWTGKEFGLGVAEWVHIVTWLFTAVFVIGAWFVVTKKITGVKDFHGFL